MTNQQKHFDDFLLTHHEHKPGMACVSTDIKVQDLQKALSEMERKFQAAREVAIDYASDIEIGDGEGVPSDHYIEDVDEEISKRLKEKGGES